MPQQSDFGRRMNIGGPSPQPQQRNALGLQQILTAQLAQDDKTLAMQKVYNRLGKYYDDPKSFSNEDLERLQQAGARYGLSVDMAAKDKATALENLGASIVGALDSMVIDFIPDDWYSSRRTETARAIGNWAGILVPAAIVAIGSGGFAAPAVMTALGATAMRGGKKAAMKLGMKEGGAALRMMEQSGAKIVQSASKMMKYTPGGLVGKYVPQGVKGAGQALQKFGPTAKYGDKLLDTGLAQAGFRTGAKNIVKKAQRFAKKGDTEGVLGVLDDVGQEYTPYLKDAVQGLVKDGKLKGITKDILEEATSKFGKTGFGVDDLDDVAKSFMGYKKTGKAARGHAQKVMDSLRNGLKNNKGIDEIIKDAGLPKVRAANLKKLWANPEQRADLLKKLAEGTPESASGIMSSLGDVGIPLGIAGFEGSMLGSSEGMDEIVDF